jgi:hypothetical protein
LRVGGRRTVRFQPLVPSTINSQLSTPSEGRQI